MRCFPETILAEQQRSRNLVNSIGSMGGLTEERTLEHVGENTLFAVAVRSEKASPATLALSWQASTSCRRINN